MAVYETVIRFSVNDGIHARYVEDALVELGADADVRPSLNPEDWTARDLQDAHALGIVDLHRAKLVQGPQAAE